MLQNLPKTASHEMWIPLDDSYDDNLSLNDYLWVLFFGMHPWLRKIHSVGNIYSPEMTYLKSLGLATACKFVRKTSTNGYIKEKPLNPLKVQIKLSNAKFRRIIWHNCWIKDQWINKIWIMFQQQHWPALKVCTALYTKNQPSKHLV